MIDRDALMRACDRVEEAALIGETWSEALDSLSLAAGCRGVIIMHNRHQRLVSYASASGIKEAVDDYLADKSSPNTRQTKVVHDADPGFLLDYDDFDPATIQSDPYYQEWLRPMGLFWHANARLSMTGADEVAIGFKRELRHGHFEPGEKVQLNAILPRLRVAAYMAECVMDAEARGMASVLRRANRSILELDGQGLVRRHDPGIDRPGGPLAVRRGQLRATDPRAQPRLERAVHTAARYPGRQALVPLPDAGGKPHLLQLLPVEGRARDVVLATCAVGS